MTALTSHPEEDDAVLPSPMLARDEDRSRHSPRPEDRGVELFELASGLLLAAGLTLSALRFPLGLWSDASALRWLAPLVMLGLVVTTTAARSLSPEAGRPRRMWPLILPWLGLTVGAAWHLRSLVALELRDDPTRFLQIGAWLAVTYWGCMTLLPGFPRSRRAGRVIWTGAALGLLVIASHLTPQASLAASAALLGAVAAVAMALRFRHRGPQDPGTIRWVLGGLWASGAGAAMILGALGLLSSSPGPPVASLSALPLLISGVVAEWQASPQDPGAGAGSL